VSLPDAAAGTGTSLREKLRRLAGGASPRGPRVNGPSPSAAAPAAGDGVEVVRARFALSHRHGDSAVGEWVDALAAGAEGIAPSGTLWLDTETTGLAGGTGTYVFLVGMGSFDGATFTVEQVLLRRLGAERRFLSLVQARLAQADHLVTFNGQRFDWPLLEARFILTRLSPVAIDLHTDLIHPARRLWHRVLGTHRLSVLETEVLGASRGDDIPGWMIPQVYVQYLRTTDRTALEPVLAHNRADLLALLGLHARVARVLRDPGEAGGPIDWEGAGVLLARGGNHRHAAMCFERALSDSPAARDLWRVLRRCARQYRALGDDGRARSMWEEAARGGRAGDGYHAQIREEVAKARERAGDLIGARAAAQDAIRLACADQMGGPPARCTLFLDRLRRRVERLGRLSATAGYG
jgi:uncharacterized protein